MRENTQAHDRRDPSASVQSLIDGGEWLRIVHKLWARKWLVLAISAVFLTIAGVEIMKIAPRYTASTLVRFDAPENEVVNLEQVLKGVPVNAATLESEIQVLVSRDLAGRVADYLELTADPEFNSSLAKEDPQTMLGKAWEDGRAWLSGAAETHLGFSLERRKDTPAEQTVRARVVDEILDRLDVRPKGQSYVLVISFESESPLTATVVSDTFAELYLLAQLEAKYEAVARATGWINERLSKLRGEVIEAERKVENFRAEHNLLEGERGATVASEQISEINQELILARAERAAAEAKLRQMESVLRREGLEEVRKVVQSDLIDTLSENLSEIDRKMADVSEVYGEKHPNMIRLKAEQRDLRSQIEAEVRKIIQSLRNEVAVARSREQTLDENLEDLKLDIGQLNRQSVQLRSLQREASAKRTLYETFLRRYEETSVQGDLQQSAAQIISEAKVPEKPSYPNRARLLLVAGFLSVSIASIIILIVESLTDRGFRSLHQVEALLGVPGLGYLPKIPSFFGQSNASDYVLKKPNSAYSETLQQIHASILLSDIDNPPKVVMFTSSFPREGKTTTAIGFARQLATSGRDVVLLDADFRRAGSASYLGLKREPGLVDLFSSDLQLEDIVQTDEKSGLKFIASGKHTRNPQDVLSSNAMHEVVRDLRGRYQFVVIDTPPVSIVSDARLLVPYVDKVAVIAKWDGTHRQIVADSVETLARSGADIAGVVLTQVDAKRNAEYGYTGVNFFSKKYASYYHN